MTDKELISQQQAQLATQAQQIKMLEEKVLLLLSQLQGQSVKKDSHNSSLPPSSDIVSKPKNLRVRLSGFSAHKSLLNFVYYGQAKKAKTPQV